MKKPVNSAPLIAGILLAVLLLVSCNIEGPTNPSREPGGTMAPDISTNFPETSVLADKKEDYIKELIFAMTVRDKAAQLILARCPLTGANELLKEYNLGGYILFSNNFKDKTRQDVLNMTAAFYDTAITPPLIAVDEEGGTVVRVSSNKNLADRRFPSPSALLSKGGFEAAYADATEKSELLLSLGINMNLAPVADVCEENRGFMYERTAQLDAEGTAEYVENVVAAMGESGIIVVLKHFPGYGSTADTHYDIAYDKRPYEDFLHSDFLPFISGINACKGGVCVLISHNVVPAIDEESPSSLSGKLNKILRTDLGFDGVIITDDLDMGAIKKFLKPSGKSPAVSALLAGNDLLILSDVKGAVDDIEWAVETGEISTERLDESVARVLALKIRAGILTVE